MKVVVDGETIKIHSLVIDEETGEERPLVVIDAFKYIGSVKRISYAMNWCEAGERIAKTCMIAINKKLE